jgi:DNA primase
MDSVSEIKTRLPIEQLVGRYVQLQKKGRNFVGLCPFHSDSRPSFLVSPDKGICYCFPCQKGGDIFSFYQLIENVDFIGALKGLAEITGITLPDAPTETVTKDEKERARECLTASQAFFAKTLNAHPATLEYLKKRGVSVEETADFGLGLAPDSYTATYEQLLKAGFSRTEILAAGMGIQNDLKDGRVHDRFRNRLMFPLHDHQGRIIGFGGRTMVNDDAKYLNTPDSPLYRKSSVLFGLHRALKHMREKKRAILVEGYFDVLACHRVGMTEAVATCGTALTEDHVKILKRSVETVVLCLDSDFAGIQAADRGFILCSSEGLRVEGIRLSEKDPADAVLESAEQFRTTLETGARPYLDLVLNDIRNTDISVPALRQSALQRLLPLLQSIASATERTHAIRQSATALGTTETALVDDLRRFEKGNSFTPKRATESSQHTASLYSSAELTLGLMLVYPRHLDLLASMLAPEDAFAAALHTALTAVSSDHTITVDSLMLSDEDRNRARILQLYCEENGLGGWSESVSIREIQHNIKMANHEQVHRKQKRITGMLLEARKTGNNEERQKLEDEYQQLLMLGRPSASSG